MQNLISKAENIELKVKQLISSLEMLKNENAFLKEENKNLIEKLKQQKGIIKELEIKSTNKEPEDSEDFNSARRDALKKEIESHIEELDQVIDALRTI